MKPHTLASLKSGSSLEGDCGSLPTVKPPWLDQEKFHRGQIFFEKHLLSLLLSMHFSLVSGFAMINLLEPLVFTTQSDTPKKAFRRYMSTFNHIRLWCTDRAIWDDPQSPGFQSTQKVRKMHVRVAKAMGKKRADKEYVSQYDMGLVQSGFMGAILTYPKHFGVQCSQRDLEDYVHLWRGIGYLLGIADDYNICSGNYEETLSIIKEIETELLVPALINRPKNFDLMSQAYIDGINQQGSLTLQSRDSMLALSYDAIGLPVPHLSLADILRFYLFKVMMMLLLWVPRLSDCLNKLVLKDLQRMNTQIEVDKKEEDQRKDSK